MGLIADFRALLIQSTGRYAARYGTGLSFVREEESDPPSTVHIPTRHGDVRCYLYRPRGDQVPPVYVHFHGGAFMMRYPAMDEFFARFVVAQTGAAVVNVDYDVAPQRRYPVAQEQAHDVLAWLGATAGDWGLDSRRIAVGGFSAGGNLAASACLQARDRGSVAPVLQLLGVPSLDVAGNSNEKPSTIRRPMITPGLLRLVRSTYFKDASRRSEPYASPLLAEDLAGLPPTIIVTAEYDRLRREGDAYAHRLTRAGVSVKHLVEIGRDHYFLDGDRRRAREVLDEFAFALIRAYDVA